MWLSEDCLNSACESSLTAEDLQEICKDPRAQKLMDGGGIDWVRLLGRDLWFFNSHAAVADEAVAGLADAVFADFRSDCKTLDASGKKQLVNTKEQQSIFIKNLFLAALNKKKLAIHLGRNYYVKNAKYDKISYKCSLKIINYLEERGYVRLIRGGSVKGIWKISRLELSHELVKLLLVNVTSGYAKDDYEKLVVLRDSDGMDVDYRGKPEYDSFQEKIEAWDERLFNYNQSLIDHTYHGFFETIGHIQVHPSLFQLRRIFNHSSFSLGGRLYGGVHQNWSKDARAKMLINNKPVIELDYSGCMIRMMYHLKGTECPYKDPYLAVVEKSNLIKSKLTPLATKGLREVVKVALITMVNNSSLNNATSSLNHSFFVSEEEDSLNSIVQKYDLDVVHGFVGKLMDAILKVHPELSKFFEKKCASLFQCLDSEIALNIISRLEELGIVGLPIHDSFIVEERYEKQLREAMVECYKKILKFEPVIK